MNARVEFARLSPSLKRGGGPTRPKPPVWKRGRAKRTPPPTFSEKPIVIPSEEATPCVKKIDGRKRKGVPSYFNLSHFFGFFETDLEVEPLASLKQDVEVRLVLQKKEKRDEFLKALVTRCR